MITLANPIIQKLEAWGCDMRGAMERMLGNEGLYMTLLPDVVGDAAFGRLSEALTAGEYRAAFEHAHQIKGFVGNMGLSPLYAVDCALVEALRREIVPKCEALALCLKAEPLRVNAAQREIGEAVKANDPDRLFTNDELKQTPEYAQARAMVSELHDLLIAAQGRCDELLRLRGQRRDLLGAAGR